MLVLTVIMTIIAIYFAKQSFNDYRIGMAMFWSFLVGWDLHTLLTL